MNMSGLLAVARGEEAADMILSGAGIINVFTGEITKGDIAVKDGFIAGIGPYEAEKRVEVNDKFIIPGFIDPHVHIESSMTSVTEFARAVMVRGTTTVIADPHEIANVLGLDGIHYMLGSAENQPIDIFFTLPSCVPATDMETAGASLPAETLGHIIDNEKILALAEVMNFPGVVAGLPDVLQKIHLTRRARKPVDGHAPGLSGLPLNAYISMGISSDHECAGPEEVHEKLAAGMHIMIREGTGARNLKALIGSITDYNNGRMMWCTDDRDALDLMEEGHIDYIVRRAIQSGVNPITAIRMATINPAEYFGLKDTGAIAPGRKANLIVLSDLREMEIERVYSYGRLVAEKGHIANGVLRPQAIKSGGSMGADLRNLGFAIGAKGPRIRVIEIVPDQIITRQVIMNAPVSDNLAVSDPRQDLLKIAVVERHRGSGNVGMGFVKGMGIKRGALASSVAHDSHNIIVVGNNDSDMLTAVCWLVEIGGGLAAVCDGEIKAGLALPIAGLMSDQPMDKVCSELRALIKAAHDMGTPLKNPFMTLSFLALPVIPSLKITDRGLVDVKRFEFVPLFIDE